MDDNFVSPASNNYERNDNPNSTNPVLVGIIFILLLVVVAGGAYAFGATQKLNKENSIVAQITPTPTITDEVPDEIAEEVLGDQSSISTTPTTSPSNTPTPTLNLKLIDPNLKAQIKLPVFTVTTAVASLTTSNPKYSCPNSFTFEGVIKTNMAGNVSYRWVKSDGSLPKTSSLIFSGTEEKKVTFSWGDIKTAGTRWVRLEVLSPNIVSSENIEFKLFCNNI